MRQRDKGGVVVGEVLVDVIRHHPDVRVTLQDLGNGDQLRAGIGGTAGVVRRIEDQPAGPRGDGPLEILGRELEPVLWPARHEHRDATGKQRDIRVRHPVWRGHDDLVALLHRAHERIEDDLLGAGADDDLAGRVVEPVLPLEFLRDGVAQLGGAAHIGVARLAGVHRGPGCLPDVSRRLEVRLAGGEADHVAARRAQLPHALSRHGAGRGLDSVKSVGELEHEASPWKGSWEKSIRHPGAPAKREIGLRRYSIFS